MATLEIERIIVRNFKAIDQADVTVSGLTILAGPNNAGKSSLLHALLCLAQSLDNRHICLKPRGQFVDVGNVCDFVQDPSKPIVVGLISTGGGGTYGAVYWFSCAHAATGYCQGLPLLTRLVTVYAGNGTAFDLRFKKWARRPVGWQFGVDELRPVYQQAKKPNGGPSGHLWHPKTLSDWEPWVDGHGPSTDPRKEEDTGRPSGLLFDWFEYLPPLRSLSPRIDWCRPETRGIEARALSTWLEYGLRDRLPARRQALPAILKGLSWRQLSGCKIPFPPGQRTKKGSTAIATANAWLSYIMGEPLTLEVRETSPQSQEFEWIVGGRHGKRRIADCGSGVSQLIPLVVGGVMNTGLEVFLLEQPELHLHPDAQLRLADFLLAVLGHINIIAETHSEHIINRLRRRVAEEPADVRSSIRNGISLVFCDRGKTGAAQYQTVRLDEYGALPSWPPGFCDQVPNEAEAIIRAREKKLHGGGKRR